MVESRGSELDAGATVEYVLIAEQLFPFSLSLNFHESVALLVVFMAKLPCFVQFALANWVTLPYECLPGVPCCDEVGLIFHNGTPVDLVFNIILIVRLTAFWLFLHHRLVFGAFALIVGAVLRIIITLTVSGHLSQVAGFRNYFSRHVVHLVSSLGGNRSRICEVRSLGGYDIPLDDRVDLSDGLLVIFLRLGGRFRLLLRLLLFWSRLWLGRLAWLLWLLLGRFGLFIRLITNARIRVRPRHATASLPARSITQVIANAVQFLAAASAHKD